MSKARLERDVSLSDVADMQEKLDDVSALPVGYSDCLMLWNGEPVSRGNFG